MANLSLGPILKTRAKSTVAAGLIGNMDPVFKMGQWSSPVAPGALGQFIFVAPRACRIVRIDYVADTNGAASSKIFLRNHAAGQSAAANAATSGTAIVDVVTGGIAADSTVRVPTSPAVVTAARDMAALAKLALVTPATWIGVVTVYGVWR